MTGSESDPQRSVFDLTCLEEIVHLMKEHGLSEVDLAQGDQKIRLQRGGGVPVATEETPTGPLSPAASPAPTPQSTVEGNPNIVTINSPMVGTFYTKPNPESEPFVKVGDHVGPETVVCIIEAMKVFNEIPADVSGRVISILMDNEETVDHGRPLIKIDTSD